MYWGHIRRNIFPHRGQTVRDRGSGAITFIVVLVEPNKFGFLHFFVGAILRKLMFSSGRSSAPWGRSVLGHKQRHFSGGIPIKVNISVKSLGRTVLEVSVLNVLGAYKENHFPPKGANG